MARKKRLIIPVFIPFGGCPNRCVFCDQSGMTGRLTLPAPEEVRGIIEAYLSTWRGAGPREAAFYGGSFTALPLEAQKKYLGCVSEYLAGGRIDGIRLSTRPDCISTEGVRFLSGYGVTTVELGAQSMDASVLKASGRGHGPEDTVRAVGILKAAGMGVGLQFMPGLPGDTVQSVLRTAREVIKLSPDFVRVYPTVVVRNTGLEEMFKEAGIWIARMGLQNTEELERSVVAGPYHPSFRDLVQGHRNEALPRNQPRG